MERVGFRLDRKINLVLNVFLVLVCIYILGLLANNYLLPVVTASKPIQVGSPANVRELKLKAQKKTVLLFLRSGCQYCTNSAGFYKRLMSRRSMIGEPYDVLALFSQDDKNADTYLQKIGLSSIENNRIDYKNLAIEGTPTLAIVDGAGVVSDVWRGYLRVSQRMEVYKALGFVTQENFMISLKDLAIQASQSEDIFVIDIRDRATFADDHLSYARNIPSDELLVRAVNEIPEKRRIVVIGGGVEENAFASDLLNDQGFSEVRILDSEL